MTPAYLGQQRVAGFHAKGLFDKVVDIDICHLQEEPTNRLRKAVRDFGLEEDLPFYDIKQHEGWLRNLQLRICTTGEIMANIVLGYEDEPPLRRLADRLVQQFPELTTLLYTINPKWNDSISDLEPRILAGKGYVIEQLEDFRFKIGPKSFFQTNTRQGERLYQVTREFAELSGGRDGI
jgi:23S rRNA (uracil1939-C5)-methyltransferase